jgi:ABC-type Mn2+/Zn2+ transport system ATPase subunit
MNSRGSTASTGDKAAKGSTTDQPPLLRLDHVTIGYPGHPVLTDIQLDLSHRSFTGLLGPNGSGKTTLLKTILGLIPPLAGRVAFLTHATRPRIGYVPQRATLDPLFLLSGFEVVLLAACARVGPLRRIPAAERDLAHQCLCDAGAAAMARRPFAQLSGGQQQRVLIARALMTGPELLVLDEPTAGIDAGAAREILESLVNLHQERSLTILMVSHDLMLVRRHVQDVIWLHQGHVLHGPVKDLLSRERLEEIMELEFN